MASPGYRIHRCVLVRRTLPALTLLLFVVFPYRWNAQSTQAHAQALLEQQVDEQVRHDGGTKVVMEFEI